MTALNIAVVRRTLYELRWHIFWYGVGIAVYAASMVLLFPTFQGVLEDTEYPKEFLEFFGGAGDMGDPRVFLQTEYFSFVPIILVIYAVIGGTGLFAGDEGRGRWRPRSLSRSRGRASTGRELQLYPRDSSRSAASTHWGGP